MWDLANLNTNSILARRGWGPSVAAHTRSVLAARRDLLAPGIMPTTEADLALSLLCEGQSLVASGA